MEKNNLNYDVAVIGAGPAGIMSAVQAAQLGLKVVLIEKNTKPGKKLLLTGNGRCNLTNAEFNLRELAKNYNNGEFLFHAFSVFGPKEVINFFESLGVKTKIENNKRVFPVSNSAEDVLKALNKYLEKNHVNILYNSEVVEIKKTGKKITQIILNSGVRVSSKTYILTTGGKSYSHTGSNGFGYELTKKLGHNIIKPVPALTPVELKESWIKELPGISLKDVKLTVTQNGKKIVSEPGEIIFTHYGISGPAVLNISGKVNELLAKGSVKILIDLFPLLNQEELKKGLEGELKKYPNKTNKNILCEFVPERFAEVLLNSKALEKNKTADNMSKPERELIAKTLKNFELTPKDILGFDNAMATRGGVSLKEIDHKTMKSKIINNLLFAGEIIDVDGKTGGFNLQMCWSTGYMAGNNCE